MAGGEGWVEVRGYAVVSGGLVEFEAATRVHGELHVAEKEEWERRDERDGSDMWAPPLLGSHVSKTTL